MRIPENAAAASPTSIDELSLKEVIEAEVRMCSFPRRHLCGATEICSSVGNQSTSFHLPVCLENWSRTVCLERWYHHHSVQGKKPRRTAV